MKITSFEYHDEKQPGWNYPKIKFHPINLFVGETGSGKTRLLNTIFDIGLFVTQGTAFKGGKWDISFENNDSNFRWKYEGKLNDENSGAVLFEELVEIKNNEERVIIKRDKDFIFNGQKLPKLASGMCSIHLLKEEDIITPIFEIFSRILRRSFSDEGIKKPLAYSNIPLALEQEMNRKKSLETMYRHDLTLSLKLFFLKKYYNNLYQEVCNFYKSIFPSIESCEVREGLNIPEIGDMSKRMPIFIIKEKNIKQPIHLQELSAGMQKVLLIMSDIISLPSNGIYLIDEYENSLGINAIDFLPSFLVDHGANKQFIITTHHPYLINNMPIMNWQVFHRKGSDVTIKNGSEYVERFGHSKQKAFIQLINDPFYSEGLQ